MMIRLRISNMCVDQIGDILVNTIPLLKPHIRWCSCQLNACTLLQNKSTQSPEFREFEQKCMMDPRTAGLPMSSFLLKPMQRVTKYPLLIDRVRLLCVLRVYHFQALHVTRPAKINHVSTKIADFSFLLCYNLIAICTNRTICLLPMENLMGFFLQFTEMGYYNHNYKY